MKKILLTAAVTIALSSAAHADSTVELKVKGLLTTAACTPALDTTNSTVDYGRIHLAELSATEDNQLVRKSVALTIDCPTATKAAWTISDDRADTHPGASEISIKNADMADNTISDTAYSYGAGTTKGSVKIGAWTVFTDPLFVTADGVAADTIYSPVASTAWQKSTTGIMKNGNLEMMTVAKAGTTEPVAFTKAIFPLHTALAIQDTTTLAITDDTKLDGQATITVKYL